MKEGIHPDYVESRIVCTSCDSVVETHATVPEMRVDLCSNCHPFYTGKRSETNKKEREKSGAGKIANLQSTFLPLLFVSRLDL